MARRAEPRRADRRSTWPSATSATSAWRARGRATTRHRREHGTAVRATCWSAAVTGCRCRSRRMPTARRSPGEVFGRIVNRSGAASQPLIVQTNPVPYRPVTLDTHEGDARHADRRDHGGRRRSASGGSARRLGLGDAARAATPFPGTPRYRHADLRARAASIRPSSTRSSTRRRTRTCSASASPPCATSASFFKTAATDDVGTAESGRAARAARASRAAARSRATSCAAGCTSGFNQAEERPARSTTACGRSSPAGASR